MSQPSSTFILLSLLLLLAVNTLFLDMVVFSRPPQPGAASTLVGVTLNGGPQMDQCPLACRSLLGQEAAKLSSPSAAVSAPVAPTSPATMGGLREVYIPLGFGSTKSSDYEELPSAEAAINTAHYPHIKQVIFEVILRNPTGNGAVYAKLFNVTDKHDVWFSEVSMIGGGTSRKEKEIGLEPGSKLYRVMLKSTLRYDAYVDTARIKIVTY